MTDKETPTTEEKNKNSTDEAEEKGNVGNSAHKTEETFPLSSTNLRKKISQTYFGLFVKLHVIYGIFAIPAAYLNFYSQEISDWTYIVSWAGTVFSFAASTSLIREARQDTTGSILKALHSIVLNVPSLLFLTLLSLIVFEGGLWVHEFLPKQVNLFIWMFFVLFILVRISLAIPIIMEEKTSLWVALKESYFTTGGKLPGKVVISYERFLWMRMIYCMVHGLVRSAPLWGLLLLCTNFIYGGYDLIMTTSAEVLVKTLLLSTPVVTYFEVQNYGAQTEKQ